MRSALARFFRRRLKDISLTQEARTEIKGQWERKQGCESLVRTQTEAQATPKTTTTVTIIFKWESETGCILIISWGNTSKLYLLLVCAYMYMMCVHHLTRPKVHFFIWVSQIDTGPCARLQNNAEKKDYISFAYILYANFFNTDTRIVVHNIKCNTQQYLI